MLSEVKLLIPASIRSAYAGEQITGTNLIYDSNWNNNVGATQDVINSGVYTALSTKPDYVAEDTIAATDDAISAEFDNRVAYTAQTKTDAKKTVARTNIGAQEVLVSGTNIKTINGNSLLGSGNIQVGSGGVTNVVFDLAGTVTWAQVDAAVTAAENPGNIMLKYPIDQIHAYYVYLRYNGKNSNGNHIFSGSQCDYMTSTITLYISEVDSSSSWNHLSKAISV